MKLSHFRGLILLSLLILGVIGLHHVFSPAPGTGAMVYFKVRKTDENYRYYSELPNDVRKRLLADRRLISAYALPENQGKQLMFNQRSDSWPLYGVKGSEFDGVSVNADFVYSDLWISLACDASELSSNKIRDVKNLISAALGEQEMKHVEVSTEIMPSFNNRP